MSREARGSRRQFLARSLAIYGSASVLGGAGVAADEQPTVLERSRRRPNEEEGPVLRPLASWPTNQLGRDAYLFAFNARQFYHNVEAEMAAVKEAGFNAIYLVYNPYRSEDGRPTPWQEDLPAEHPDYPAVARLTDKDRSDEAEVFQRVLAACRRQGLKVLFNVGCWTPQTWFRSHAEAISRLPDGSPQYDSIFLNQHKSIYTQCFRSETFRGYTQRIVRGWLQQNHGRSEFESVLCRCRLPDQFDIRLDDRGFPLFFLHQDTVDRNWCHCQTCQAAFRQQLQQRYGSIERANIELGTSFSAFSEISIPLSPGQGANRRRFQAIDLRAEPQKTQGLWYEAACLWSEGIAGWRAGIVKAVRQFYADGEVMMVSKYPKNPFLTDYPRIDRGGKVFLMDSYPMEVGRNWEFLRWLCDLEVYQSAAQRQGQAIMAHLDGFDNASWVSRPCRAPWPEEFAQQHVAMIARGIGAAMTFGFNHVVQLCPSGEPQGLLPQDAVMKIVHQRHAVADRIERASRGTAPYRRGVVLRYQPREICNPGGAAAVYARYKYWKDRGTPVSLIWDEKQAGETVPERFEFLLEGNDPSEMDLSIRCRGSFYVVTLINLRNGPRDLRLRVRLEGQVMDRYHARRVDEDAPVAMERSVEALYCKMSIPPLGSAVLRLDRSKD